MNASESTTQGEGSVADDIVQQRRRTALVLDADKVLRVTLGRFLERLGFQVRLFADGYGAIAALRSAPVDFVMMDARVSGLDGFEACSLMRALPNVERTPIMIMLGRDDRASVERAIEAGASDYIIKPVSWPVLRHRVNQLVTSAAAERTLRDHHTTVQSLVDASNDPAVVCDGEGVVRWANRAAMSARGICEASVGERLHFDEAVQDAEVSTSRGEDLVTELCESTIDAGRAQQRLLERFRRGEPPLFAQLLARPLGGKEDRRGMILTLRDVTQQEMARRNVNNRLSQLDERANHDGLTGLANRRLFRQRLDDAVDASGEAGNLVALVMLEVDGLDSAAEGLDQALSDRLIQTVSARLGTLVRRADTVARLGDDAFAIIVRDCPNAEIAARIGQKAVAAMGEPLPGELGERHIGASVGVAVYPSDARTAAELVRLADAAMCRVKHSGKGGLCIHGREP